MYIYKGSHFFSSEEIPGLFADFSSICAIFPWLILQVQKCIYHLKLNKLSNQVKKIYIEITKILPFPHYSPMTDIFSECWVNFEEKYVFL